MQVVEFSKREFLQTPQKATTFTVVNSQFHLKNVLLGSGARSRVYACWDSKRQDLCVAKVITLQSQDSTTQQTDSPEIDKLSAFTALENEAAMAMKLSHSNVIRFYDLLEKNISLYLFLEYCDQGTLQEFFSSTNSIDFKAILLIFKKITRACSYMHRQGIFHRNLNPGTIMMSDGEPKISGFRFAVEFTMFDSGLDAGEYQWPKNDQYLAPQIHLLKKRVTPKSDVWSLGVTFYQVLCGKLPWEADKDMAWSQIMRRPVQFPPEVEVPNYIKQSIRNMLEYEDSKRPNMGLVSDYFNF